MPFRTASLAVVLISLLAAATASAPAQDEQVSLKDLESIGSELSSPDHHPVHIIYVHGINQVGAGDSSLLRDSICKELHLCDTSDWKYAGSEFPDHGEFVPGAAPPRLYYLGEPVWADQEQWEAAAPFVAHYVIHLKRYPAPLVVDEINWWPLVLALKCEHVVRSEASLAGANKDLLQVCSEKSAQDPGDLGRFYPWLSVSEADRLAKMPARAVVINRNMKNGLEDWGFSDAMIGVGPLSEIIRDGLRQLMVKSASFDPNGTDSSARTRYDWKCQLSSGNTTDQTFIGVTHSLGSYLLFNTLNLEDVPPEAAAAQSLSAAQSETMDENRAVQYIFERMSLVYFFANQLLLLEFTDIQGLPTEAAATPHAAGAPAPSTRHFGDLVSRWSQYRQAYQKRTQGDKAVPQNAVHIVAWSDPSDLLTWRMPKIGDVEVVNLYAHNATHWFWLYESPTGAHDNYARNKAVLRVMFPKR